MSEPCTCLHCNAKQNRIAAFGAIRRAATIARQYDEPVFWENTGCSDAIRIAIRAAIGPVKA